jgi:hypothetical protein
MDPFVQRFVAKKTMSALHLEKKRQSKKGGRKKDRK